MLDKEQGRQLAARLAWAAMLCGAPAAPLPAAAGPAEPPAARFDGQFFSGRGDADYLRLLDTAYGMFTPNPRLQHLAMLYMPGWNGLVEGPTWDAWWIQNSYGTTFAALPLLLEPFLTFLQNSQDLWFDQMGDGQRTGAAPPFDWIAPDGALCDAARPGWIVYKQGDGRTGIHDWGMEFTAAGVVMQAELLLISRNRQAIARYLPRLERCANFIETRRDPTNDLFLAGPAGELLAPSYAGWKKPDGTYGMAYLAGLSVNYIAALDRLIELEKLARQTDKAELYLQRRNRARRGLGRLRTEDGYFIRSLDPDGTRHGVFGAARHGYFEASPNHDAIAFHVVDDAAAERIMAKMTSLAGLRPHDFVLPNYPSYDDLYERPEGLWAYGTWVNGGHWSTCEARMILAYYRLDRFEDTRKSMRRLLTFAERFRLDNPLVRFGSDVYQPAQPINLTYDAFGPPAAFVRGLFEYLYTADGLRLIPHIPPGIEQLEQRFPIRFGAKRLYLATAGHGPVTTVRINGEPWNDFDAQSVFLPADISPITLQVSLGLGGAEPPPLGTPTVPRPLRAPPPPNDPFWDVQALCDPLSGNNLPLRIGADPFGGNGFVGEIKGARLHRRALAETEVAQLAEAASAKSPRSPSLLAAYYPERLSGDTVANTGGRGLAAALRGQVTVAGEGPDRAFRFAGQGSLEVETHRDLALREDYTLDAWIRPGTIPPTGGRILDRCTPGTSDGYMMDYGCQGQLRFICESGQLAVPAALDTNAWHHVAATLDRKHQLALYLDGQLLARRQGSPPPQPVPARNLATIGAFHSQLREAGLADTSEAQHARLILDCIAATQERIRLKSIGQITPLPGRSQLAADRGCLETIDKLAQGLERLMTACRASTDPDRQRLAAIWDSGQSAAQPGPPNPADGRE